MRELEIGKMQDYLSVGSNGLGGNTCKMGKECAGAVGLENKEHKTPLIVG